MPKQIWFRRRKSVLLLNSSYLCFGWPNVCRWNALLLNDHPDSRGCREIIRRSLTWVLQSRSLWREIACAQTSSVSAIASGLLFRLKKDFAWRLKIYWPTEMDWPGLADATVANSRFLDAAARYAASRHSLCLWLTAAIIIKYGGFGRQTRRKQNVSSCNLAPERHLRHMVKIWPPLWANRAQCKTCSYRWR